MTTSVGVATLDEYHSDLEQILAAADDAMYQAKASGRNNTRVAALRRPVNDLTGAHALLVNEHNNA